MRMYDIIETKKNNQELTKEQIEFFVNGYTNGNIKDYQMSSLLMAIVLNGMNDRETTDLTLAMANSGDKIDLKGCVDKHSTGGIGDKTTLIVGPIVASLGCKVAKMSGRGLGYTGGTIDKLESIDGFKVEMSKEDFYKQVNDINISIISQTSNIAPADKKIYALRDVTCTVESIPLIASSIMSKKIAGGSSNLVLDVKVGSGAFMKNVENARKLASKMVNIGKLSHINTVAILTNMDIPLGNNIGNKLEVIEAIEVLKGNGPDDLKEVCINIAGLMYSITKNVDLGTSKKLVLEVLKNGKAYEKFIELIKYQGGNINIINNPKYKYEIYSNSKGYINKMDCENIGKIACMIGAGRINKEDKIDYTAGIILNKKTGDYVDNDLLCTLYSSTIENLNKYKDEYLSCITIGDKPVFNLIYDIISE